MTPNANPDESPTLSQRVLLALKQTRSKLEAYERARCEPIAIVGIGCRFPGGADNPDLFWEMLCQGVDAISGVPGDRWNADEYYDPDPTVPGKTCIRGGGFLQHVDLFDAEFFGISPREARSMDPQQRLLLEVAWEAFENAGQGREQLFGNRVGVFIGIGNVDYARLMHDSVRLEAIDLYSTTGNVFSAAAGRLSYTLGLQGPCMALDTACSSSLVAIHLACQSLRNEESEMAVAGGVNLILSPQTTIAMSRVPGGLSPDGRCKTFDASANGLGRGEGCGLVVLKRLSDAVRDRDHVIAQIRGSAVNQDGRSAGLTVPNGQAQVALLEQALANSRLTPDQVSYIEAHGPGTALGDPIEVGALGTVFGQSRQRENPLVVGSVKTNIGHLESAAGVAGLIKTALLLQYREIPANLHFHTPNPHIPWDHLPIRIPTEHGVFSPMVQSRIAGVSAFGVAGTNAHAILEEPPSPSRAEEAEPSPGKTKYLLTLSAKSEHALQELTSRYRSYFEQKPQVPLGDVCYTAGSGRFHFAHRLAIIADSADMMTGRLEACRSSRLSSHIYRGFSASPPRVGFLFSNSDALEAERWRELYAISSAFRESFDECGRLLQAKAGWELSVCLDLGKMERSLLDEQKYRCPALFALEYSLTHMWRSWGFTPSVVIGQGTGDITAACVAGILQLEDSLDLSLAWGDLRDSNGTLQTVEESFVTVFSQITCSKPRIPVVSQIIGHRVADEMASDRYWIRAYERVHHSSGDISPGESIDVLVKAAEQLSGDASLATLAKIYVAGGTIHWESFYKESSGRRIALPTYPFQRQRYWFEKRERRKEVEPTVSDPIGDMFYEEEWRPQAVTETASAQTMLSTAGAWIIFADKNEVGTQTAAQLEQNGDRCILVLRGESYQEAGDGAVYLNPSCSEDFARLFARLSEKGLSPLKGVLYLWSIDSSGSDSLSLGELNGGVNEECCSLLHLVQELMKRHSASPPKIWLVSRGAMQVEAAEIPCIGQSPLWGMTAVLEHEHPELGCMRIDLDPGAGFSAVASLLAEIRLTTKEKRVAYRGDQRFVARLVQSRHIPAPNSSWSFRPDASYLITGGLGGLGRLVAGWMIDRGAKHVVLTGRRMPDSETLLQVQELQRSGAQVTIIPSDVSDPEEVESLLSLCADPPLRGIFHCAGVLDDGVFLNQSREKFERVLRPKVAGARNLHQLSSDAELDFFVLFSSGASVFGNPGQANYAAANAYLDSLARYRRAKGLPGLSINWGIWSSVGGIAERQLDTVINAAGVGSICPEDGLKALDRLHSFASPQAVVVPIRWTEFLSRAEDWSYVDDFRRRSSGDSDKPTPLIEVLKKAPARERRSLLFNHIRSQVDEVLGVRTTSSSSARQGFFEMGMDSLTAVELKNRLRTSLGCNLPSTIAFECPTIDALVDHLAKEELASLFPVSEVVEAETASTGDSIRTDITVDQLSEAEVTRLMDDRLNSIEALLEK